MSAYSKGQTEEMEEDGHDNRVPDSDTRRK